MLKYKYIAITLLALYSASISAVHTKHNPDHTEGHRVAKIRLAQVANYRLHQYRIPCGPKPNLKLRRKLNIGILSNMAELLSQRELQCNNPLREIDTHAAENPAQVFPSGASYLQSFQYTKAFSKKLITTPEGLDAKYPHSNNPENNCLIDVKEMIGRINRPYAQ